VLKREAAPLRASAVAAIRLAIVEGTYPAGSRLKEKDLEQSLEVSRTVIREALRQLESEQLVRIQPNVGPVVVQLTKRDVAELYEVRAVFESAAGRLAATEGTETEIASIGAAFEAIAGADATSLQDLVRLKNRFYSTLFAAGHNAILEQFHANVQSRISQLRAVTLQTPGRMANTVQELRRVVEAIQTGRPDEASEACLAHVNAARDIAMRHFEEHHNK
jgi:DNA-binding GntR family transcriptional regulator